MTDREGDKFPPKVRKVNRTLKNGHARAELEILRTPYDERKKEGI